MSQPKVTERDAAFTMKARGVREMKKKGGEKEIVGAPVMIRLITEAWLLLFMCAVCTRGLAEIEGVHWERADRVFK